MGEYFSWINLDKKEYIIPSDFDMGSKRYESVYVNNALLCALKELMEKEWRDSKIIFLGDECDKSSINIPDMLNVILLDDKFEGSFIEYTYENFKNVSCKFEAARNVESEEIFGGSYRYVAGMDRAKKFFKNAGSMNYSLFS